MTVPTKVERIAFLARKIAMLERLHAITSDVMQQIIDTDIESRSHTSAAVEELKRLTGVKQ